MYFIQQDTGIEYRLYFVCAKCVSISHHLRLSMYKLLVSPVCSCYFPFLVICLYRWLADCLALCVHFANSNIVCMRLLSYEESDRERTMAICCVGFHPTHIKLQFCCCCCCWYSYPLFSFYMIRMRPYRLVSVSSV